MTLSPTDIVQLSALTENTALAGGDLIPVLRSGPLQFAKASTVAAYVQGSVKTFGALGDGVTDDTSAIQAAINSGQSIYFPPGTYNVSASLLVQSYTNNGQTLRGAGSWAAANSSGISTTPPPSATVIKPTVALSGKAVFIIDGTPIGGLSTTWVQGFGLENMAIDMVNMSDVPGSVAINQIQAWDCRYTNVRVRNDGATKRAWLFSAGAFTTTLLNTQGNFIEATGTSPGYGVTTVNFINHDGGQMQMTYAVNIRVYGGAFQGSGTKFKLRNVGDITLETDVEGTGVFLDVDSSANCIKSRCQLQGFSGTYMVGTPGLSSMIFDQQVNFNTYPFNMTVGGALFNNQGVAGLSRFLSGAAGADYYLGVGRTGDDVRLGTAGIANDYMSGTAAGDGALYTVNNTSLWLGVAQVAVLKLTAAGASLTGRLTTTGQVSVNNQGVSGGSGFLSGGATNFQYIDVGRTATDGRFGVAGVAGDLMPDTVQGDVVLFSNTSNSLHLGTFGARAATINGSQQILLPVLQASASYATDAAAATGGVPVGGLYRNGSVVQVRVA